MGAEKQRLHLQLQALQEKEKQHHEKLQELLQKLDSVRSPRKGKSNATSAANSRPTTSSSARPQSRGFTRGLPDELFAHLTHHEDGQQDTNDDGLDEEEIRIRDLSATRAKALFERARLADEVSVLIASQQLQIIKLPMLTICITSH
jgi:hypothetical protein